MPEAGYRLDPAGIIAALNRHGVDYVLIGGLAAVLHGSPYQTQDADITPAAGRENLARLAAALIDLEARLRVANEPDGIPFDRSAEALEKASIWNLQTTCGMFDLSFTPSGTGGYADLVDNAITLQLGGEMVNVASLADIVRSKEAAGRVKDLAVLPTLRALLERQERG
ncbi:MAG: hypothetical protein M3507_11660 [Actinomycetota bacterium]|nr:hypothetical protein [Actinomycetota bacterium]